MKKIILIISLFAAFTVQAKPTAKPATKGKERIVASVPPTEYYLNTAQMSAGFTINSSTEDQLVVSFQGVSKNGAASATC